MFRSVTSTKKKKRKTGHVFTAKLSTRCDFIFNAFYTFSDVLNGGRCKDIGEKKREN
jgi:hypothetical protein